MARIGNIIQGDAAKVEVLTYTSGTLSDPANTPTITIQSRSGDFLQVGGLDVDREDMTKEAVGTYTYLVQLTETTPVGFYWVRIDISDGAEYVSEAIFQVVSNIVKHD